MNGTIATIKASGSQLRVKAGDIVTVDRVKTEPGATLTFEDVLLVEDDEQFTAGQPHVAGAKVEAEVLEHFRGAKIRVFKMNKRKKYRRTKGHRSELSKLRITQIIHK